MIEFPVHSESNHPDKSADVLSKAKTRYGFIPNLVGALSEAPQVANAYMDLSDAVASSSLSAEERHVAWFTANTYHGCDYCMAAHTAMAKGQGISDDVINTARAGKDYSNPKLQALQDFTITVLDERGWVNPQAVQAFLDAGFTRQNVLEVILVVTHKTLSNYTNHIVNTPLDEKFAPFAWEASQKAAE